MNRAVAFNAPSFNTHQRDVLAVDANVSGLSKHLQQGLTVNENFEMDKANHEKPGVNALITESRKIIDHPQNNDWWKPIIKKYATDSKTQQFLKDFIKARNSGFATFREHEH